MVWLAWLALAACAQAAEAQPGVLSDDALIAALRSGGYVIYFRHADTGPATPDPPGFELQRCETQRNLNEKGRAEAKAIGDAFVQLKIPVARVLTSPFCRCRDTGDLAFGRYEIDPGLAGVPRGAQFATAREKGAEVLRALLSTPPSAGSNTVLVAHGFNLIDLDGLYLETQGEAAVFEPWGTRGYRLIARVLPGNVDRVGSQRSGHAMSLAGRPSVARPGVAISLILAPLRDGQSRNRLRDAPTAAMVFARPSAPALRQQPAPPPT
jgi:broad specificity phosphatase PhoE